MVSGLIYSHSLRTFHTRFPFAFYFFKSLARLNRSLANPLYKRYPIILLELLVLVSIRFLALFHLIPCISLSYFHSRYFFFTIGVLYIFSLRRLALLYSNIFTLYSFLLIILYYTWDFYPFFYV